MPALDLRTMYFLLMLSSLMAGLCVLLLDVAPGPRRQSARQWGIGSLLAALGLALVGLRDVIPLYVSAMVGNVSMMWGFLLLFMAYRQLLQRPCNTRVMLGVALAYALLFHGLVMAEVAVRYRIGVVSAALVLLGLVVLKASRLPHEAAPYTRNARLLMQVFYGMVIGTSVLRGVHSVFFEHGATLIFESTTIQLLHFMGSFFALIGASIAYLLTQNALTYADLAMIASSDPLTGVRNRRNFLDMAERDWAISQRLWRPLAVMMLDPDHLPRITREFGQATRDDVLHHFGDVLRRNVRNVDLVGRHGSTGFCIVLADTSPESARHSAERIRQEFRQLELRAHDKPLPLDVSIGIAGNAAGDTRTMPQILAAAEQAVQAARTTGHVQVEAG